MFDALQGLHSTLRYVVLILLVSAIIKSILGWIQKGDYQKGHNKLSLFTMVFTHIQLLLGLSLYFMSAIVKEAHSDMGAAMKEAVLRFWAVEHISMMIIAAILITIGRRFAKNAEEDIAKHKKTTIFFLIAFVIIMAAIPWPFRAEIGRGYFFGG
ncbi:MAG: cytochrome B [Flavobacteriales bacterium]|nr:cytochrome B [Flavobacteriales bacterium]